MKQKLFKLFLTICLVLSVKVANSQYYNTGIGVRIGSYTGLGVKHFLNDANALEGMISFPWNGIVLGHILYEFQKPIKEVEFLSWYIGCGGHVGGAGGEAVIGVDIILGMEYTFKELPFCLGLDWKPEVNFVGDHEFWADKVTLTFKYVFK